jgi:hypothetical protein
MSNVVFVFGAGASRQVGAPIMEDFLDTADQLWRTGTVDSVRECFELVFKAIGKLQLVHSKSQLDIKNIEAVFAAFEMAKTINRFPNYNSEDIDNLIQSMKVLIVKTLEHTIPFPVIDKSITIPSPYRDFTDLILFFRERAKPPLSVSIITFNYDIVVDFSLFSSGFSIDYSLGDPCPVNSLPLLKLHGSINWANCIECKNVIPWKFDEYQKKYSFQLLGNPAAALIPIGSQLTKFEHCGTRVDSTPVIIPPTWNKTEYHRTLSKVWSRAAHELSDAENIFVIGYSLPETDLFFHYLYSLGTVGDVPFKRFWVFNPDESGKVENRFSKMLGSGALDRFKYFPINFSEALPEIKKAFEGKTFKRAI